jgi:spore germination protein KB
MIPSGAVGLAGMTIVLALLRRFPGASVIEYAPQLAGPVLGRIYLILLGLVLLAGAPANLHTLVEMTRFSELPRMSPLWIATLFAGMVAVGCYFGPEVIARVGEVMGPLLLLALIGMYASPLPAAVPARLFPLSGFNWQGYLSPAILATLGALRGFLCVLVLGGMVNDRRGVGLWALGAILAAWVLLALSFAEPVMVLGTGLAKTLRYPLLAVTGTVSFRWLPFQRFTTVVVMVWELLMYMVFGFYLWSGVDVLSAAVGLRQRRAAIIVWAGVAAFIAGASVRRRVFRGGTSIWDFSVILVGVILPLLLLLLARRHAAPGEAEQ